ncbi:MAG: hypothetical protein SPE20_08545 [Helicobacter sp.]|uniref:hypothetical protein n=1 Tax=Helicobacter sp. TaxID=218 RepID=UPI002A814112|nr:hypothetical protein [Helicobacter sp.]MDY4427381.1 hypothetical protein [Helicobacter sp.]
MLFFSSFYYLMCLENEILKTLYLKSIKDIKLLKENFEASLDISRILKNANSVV